MDTQPYLNIDAATSRGGLIELLPWAGRVAEVLLLPKTERDNLARPGSRWEVGIDTKEDSSRGPRARSDWRWSPEVWPEVEADLASMAKPAYLTVLLRAPEEPTGPVRDRWTASMSMLNIDTFRRTSPGAGIHLTLLERDRAAQAIMAEQLEMLRADLVALDLGVTFEDQ
jgi:hypothetical protein